MPFRTYKCGECDYTEKYFQQPAADGGYTNPAPDNCPKCGSDTYEKDFIANIQNISFDVPGGYDYEYGKKAAASGMAGADAQADAMYKASIGENPY
jgi:predicted nucleic-acid-binding Zn-ribbon protein